MSKKLSKSAVNAKQLAAYVSSVVQTLDALSSAREQWEQTEYKTATASLYDLLARTYAAYEQSFLSADDSQRKALREELVSVLKADGVRVQRNATTLGLLIRFVFRSDRKRVMRYRYVVEAAKSHGIAASSFAAWVADCGGIDAVVKLMSATEETRKKQETLSRAIAEVQSLIARRVDRPLATVAIDGFSASGTIALIAQASIDGTLRIVCGVSNISEGLYKSLVKVAATQHVADKTTIEALNREARKLVEAKASNDSDMKDAA